MNKFLVAIAGGLLLTPIAATVAQTPPPASATPSHYTSEDTDLGTLLDDPAAKAVLARHIPDLLKSDQIDMARSMTLKTMQTYAPDKLSDKTLSDIDVELARLPVKK